MQRPSSQREQPGPVQGTSAVLKFSGSFIIACIELFAMHHRDTMMLIFDPAQITLAWVGCETVPFY
jgi:hypothetical protein